MRRISACSPKSLSRSFNRVKKLLQCRNFRFRTNRPILRALAANLTPIHFPRRLKSRKKGRKCRQNSWIKCTRYRSQRKRAQIERQWLALYQTIVNLCKSSWANKKWSVCRSGIRPPSINRQKGKCLPSLTAQRAKRAWIRSLLVMKIKSHSQRPAKRIRTRQRMRTTTERVQLSISSRCRHPRWTKLLKSSTSISQFSSMTGLSMSDKNRHSPKNRFLW